MKKPSIIFVSTLLFCSCINSDYDLGNIDTTTRVSFNNLVVPINVDKVPLRSILDVDDNSKIKEIDGEYAVVIEGDFTSETIHVDKFTASVDKIEPISGQIEKKRVTINSKGNNITRNSDATGNLIATYDLPQKKTGIIAKTKTISDAIRGLTSLEVNTTLHLTLNVDNDKKLSSLLKNIRIENLKLQLPHGVEGTISLGSEDDGNQIYGSYNSETGIASFAEYSILTNQGEVQVNVHVTGLDKNAVEDALDKLDQMGDDFVLDEEYGIISGNIAVYSDDFLETNTRSSIEDNAKYDLLPDNLFYNSNAAMDNIEVSSISGNIDYEVNDTKLEKVRLNNLPDILSESGTNIGLANPQIYLYIKNPIADGMGKTIGASTKIKINATSKDGKTNVFDLDENSVINADKPKNYFCLSPKEVSNNKKYQGYENSDNISYSSLSTLLGDPSSDTSQTLEDLSSGKGIPENIEITIYDTHIKSNNIDKYELGQDYNVDGTYVFYAPLELTENSKIRYNEKVDGMKDDLSGLVITEMSVEANATSDIPFDILLKITPFDDKGNKIKGEYTTAVIPSKANSSKVNLKISGNEFSNVDGIYFDAMAVAKEVDTLKPNMNISLNQIKVKVSGYYQTKFE